MSHPRRIVPCTVSLLTRRCSQRMFLLRPDERTTKVINYCLAEAARRHNIELIVWLFMSNHYHAVVHDPYGNISRFIAHFHRMLAKALNHRWLRKENLWSSTETCVTLLPTHEDILRKVVYVLTNPVKAHLVGKVEDWPGASAWDYLDGGAQPHLRPDGYFRKTRKGSHGRPPPRERMPVVANLEAVPPPSLNGEPAMSRSAWVKQVRAAVAEKEKAWRLVRRREKISLLTAQGVLDQEHTDSPESEPPRCELRPTVACHDRKLRGHELAKIRFFRMNYRRALRRYRDGDVTVLFPIGTYHMRSLGARCTLAPPE